MTGRASNGGKRRWENGHRNNARRTSNGCARSGRIGVGGGGTTAVTKAAPKGALPTVVRPVSRAPIEGTVVTDLDEAIMARQREIEVLQQAKEILERC